MFHVVMTIRLAVNKKKNAEVPLVALCPSAIVLANLAVNTKLTAFNLSGVADR